MKLPHLVIVGCGDIGVRVGRQLLAQGWRVTGLRRDPSQIPPEFGALAGDYSTPDGLSALRGQSIDYALFTPVPLGRSADAYQRGFHDPVSQMSAVSELAAVRRFFYVSSTRVYAENAGGAVDETSPLVSDDPAGLAIITGENAARAHFSTTVVRPSGLYGDGPGMLLERVATGQGSADPARISNRLHRDDLAGLLAHLLRADEAGIAVPELLNATDDAPTTIGEVEDWLAAELGVTITERVPATRQVGSRAIANQRLHDTGYRLRYPDFRAGYAPAIAAVRSGQR